MPRRSERPTTPPLFDVLQYARESDANTKTVRPIAFEEELASVERVSDRAADGSLLDDDSSTAEVPSSPEPHSETRLTTRPTMGATLTDEGWARGMVGAPVVVMPHDQLRRLPLDHRAGFLLSLMDGTIDLATVIEVSAMPPSDALRAVRDLFDAGVVGFV